MLGVDKWLSATFLGIDSRRRRAFNRVEVSVRAISHPVQGSMRRAPDTTKHFCLRKLGAIPDVDAYISFCAPASRDGK
jgi:hypothetical protein